jgi:hypothetical protein
MPASRYEAIKRGKGLADVFVAHRIRKAHVERVARFIRIRADELAWRLVPRDRSNYCCIVARILRGSKACHQ